MTREVRWKNQMRNKILNVVEAGDGLDNKYDQKKKRRRKRRRGSCGGGEEGR